jgi:signal transduction histidine kinase/ligand-binding sensor domain-containing protein
MSYTRSLLIILLFVLVKPGFSQVLQPEFNLLRGTDSLTLGKINSIAQDKYGYMWFADQTYRCLLRYDGYHIKIYKHDPLDSNSTACKDFESIAADASGNIWIDIPGGVERFDFATNKFIHFRYPSAKESIGANKILIDHSGIVWIGTGDDGLYSFDPATGKFVHYEYQDNNPSSISCNIVRSLFEDSKGVLWVGTGIEFVNNTNEGGLNKFNKETGTFTRYLHDANNPQSLISNKVRAIFEDSKGNFWVGTNGDGLHLMNRDKGTFERLTYDPSYPEKLSRPPIKNGEDYDNITFITEDKTGKIWIGTYAQGIVVYDPDTKTIKRFTSDDKKRPGGYPDNGTFTSYISKEGVIWIANDYSELFRIDPLKTGFSEVKMNGTVYRFIEDSSGNLLMTTEREGLIIINKKTNAKNSFVHGPNDSSSLSKFNFGFLKLGKENQFWIGSGNGVNLFNPKTGRFKKFFYNPKNDSNNSVVLGVHEIGNETYFGFIGKLAIQNNETGIITYYKNDPKDTNSISEGGVINFLDNADGNIWITVYNDEGKNGALELFNPKTKKFKHYLRGLTVWDIFRSSHGKIWVGTNNGLYFRNDSLDSFFQSGPEGSEFRRAKTRVKSMTEDADGNIWGISTLGIFKLNPETNELGLFGDRFGTFDVGALAYEPTYRASDGELYFGNPHGYYKCFPKNVFSPLAPQIQITDFKINGHSTTSGRDAVWKGILQEADEITLRHDQNKISIDFAAIHFSDPGNNIHQYMLEGYQSEWRTAKEEKTAYYIGIPTGHYVFRIRARSSYGVLAERSIKIIVLPPWWLTWWAYTLYALLLGLAIWAFIKWRTRALEKEKNLLENKVALRTKELKNEKEIVESTLAELKATQGQLIQSEKMASLGELTAGIAHEIQNPLNFVNNFSELNNELIEELKTQKSQLKSQDQDEILNEIFQNNEKISHHGKRADAIVKGMLQHSRVSTGAKEPTDINALADEYLRLAYHGLRAKDKGFNTEIKTDFDKSIEKINVIPQDMGRVLLNLYNNAFYAVNEKRKLDGQGYKPIVSLSTKKINDKIVLTVADNGAGIPKKIIDKIFQPFFTTKPAGQGTGLGLSLSYDIVKVHGGEIKLNTKENEGSEFIIELPSK